MVCPFKDWKTLQLVVLLLNLLSLLSIHQVELDSTIRDSLSDGKTDNYYHHNFTRCQGLITHISNMTDGVSMLTQATHTLLKGQFWIQATHICKMPLCLYNGRLEK